MTIWFTGDHHFGHRNIIEHTERPFKSVQEMDRHLMKVWNERVHEDDTVYHLGDFCWWKGSVPYFQRVAEGLNGTICLLVGNHDRTDTDLSYQFLWSVDYYLLQVEPHEPEWVLCHYPFQTWRKSGKGAIHLHGHSHGKLSHRNNRIDVGVDTHPDYAPFSLKEIEQRIKDEAVIYNRPCGS